MLAFNFKVFLLTMALLKLGQSVMCPVCKVINADIVPDELPTECSSDVEYKIDCSGDSKCYHILLRDNTNADYQDHHFCTDDDVKKYIGRNIIKTYGGNKMFPNYITSPTMEYKKYDPWDLFNASTTSPTPQTFSTTPSDTTCNAGERYATAINDCEPCPLDTYMSESNHTNTECTPCEDGSTAATGSSKCKEKEVEVEPNGSNRGVTYSFIALILAIIKLAA